MKPKLFFRSHKRKIVAGAPIIFLLLLGSSGILAGGNTLTLNTDSIFVSTNDEVLVTLNLSTKTPINAAGGTVTFPPELLAISTLSRSASIIDLWSEEPVTSNETGTVRFSGGIIGPKVGSSGNRGPVFTLNLRALKEGKATIRVKDGELLANDGSGSNQISSTGVLTLYIRASGRPTPDINSDGELTIADVNSLYIKTFRSYDERYDINGDGKVDWTDVRTLISLL